jgi:glycine/D-amino acid oxidase-like deaminating enzyme
MTGSGDVVVIGAGVMGSSVAHELARDGYRVLVVDKLGAVGHGSTSASSAIVRFNYSTWAGVALAWESLHAWRDWAGLLGAAGEPLAAFRRTGMLVVPADPVRLEATTALFDRAGVRWEHWTARDIARRAPALDPGRFGPPSPIDAPEFFAASRGEIDGLWTPDAGYVDDPALAAQNLAHAAERRGAGFLMRRAVTGVRRSGSRWTVSTSAGDLRADIVVNAAGPWSGQVNALAGVEGDFGVRTRPMRQEVHEVEAPPGYSGDAAIAVADLDLGTYLRPSGDGHLLVGGTEPECDPLDWVEDPEEVDLRPTAARFRTQVTRAARRLPGLRIPSRPSGVVGLYDVTDDWTPIYDKTSAPGFYVAIGTSGNQFKNAPLVGRLMARLVAATGEGKDHDLDPVSVLLPRTGHTIDLGAFSRGREVGADAPHNVLG